MTADQSKTTPRAGSFWGGHVSLRAILWDERVRIYTGGESVTPELELGGERPFAPDVAVLTRGGEGKGCM